MAYSLAQNPTVATGTGASISKAFASTVTAHSVLVAFVTTDATTPGTFTYTGGGTWASTGSVKETSSTQWISLGYCLDATGGTAPTIQAAWTGTGNFNGILLAEFTNAGVASVLDTSTAGAIGTVALAATDSTMTLTGTDLAVGMTLLDTASTVIVGANGFTVGTTTDTPDSMYWEYVLSVSSTATAKFTWSTGSSHWAIRSAAFKPAGGAAPVLPYVTMAPISGY